MGAIKNHFHDEICRNEDDGIWPCENCNGTGVVDAAFSGSDPSCPECSGERLLYNAPVCPKCGEELRAGEWCANHGRMRA